jgi:acylphosphatase
MKRIKAIARGRVQGVGYRYFVIDCARKAGVSGFVKNMPDGSVLMVAEGRQEALDNFLSMARALSEPGMRVDDISVKPEEASGEFTGFFVEWDE